MFEHVSIKTINQKSWNLFCWTNLTIIGSYMFMHFPDLHCPTTKWFFKHLQTNYTLVSCYISKTGSLIKTYCCLPIWVSPRETFQDLRTVCVFVLLKPPACFFSSGFFQFSNDLSFFHSGHPQSSSVFYSSFKGFSLGFVQFSMVFLEDLSSCPSDPSWFNRRPRLRAVSPADPSTPSAARRPCAWRQRHPRWIQPGTGEPLEIYRRRFFQLEVVLKLKSLFVLKNRNQPVLKMLFIVITCYNLKLKRSTDVDHLVKPVSRTLDFSEFLTVNDHSKTRKGSISIWKRTPLIFSQRISWS